MSLTQRFTVTKCSRISDTEAGVICETKFDNFPSKNSVRERGRSDEDWAIYARMVLVGLIISNKVTLIERTL
jgi:hypothetical protein